MNKHGSVKSVGVVILILIIVSGGGLILRKYLSTTSVKDVQKKKVLFYRSPMNPKVTSPTPMKDEMGMDYVPVYEESEGERKGDTPGTVKISPEKIQKIGVKSEEVKRRTLRRTIRTVGRVEPDERMVYNINAKIGGWVERLYINTTDRMVKHNEPLLELYSPELVSAQEEYLLAFKSKEKSEGSTFTEIKGNTESLLNAARQRLRYWDISDDQIKRLEEDGKITRTMTIRAPSHGSVTEKMVVEGAKIEAGEPLFKIIDHSSVWVYGEVYEYELPFVKIGQMAKITPSYYPEDVYTGTINHIYSHLGSITYTPESSAEVRTAKIRFELPNSAHKLKLGMYVNVELQVETARNSLSIPDSALIDTGTRQVVIIDKGDGRFEPREVRIGAKADNYYEVIEGIKDGESVVTSANFLIDSESNLNAAFNGMGGMGSHQHEKTPTKEPEKKEEEKPMEHHHH